MSYTIIILFLTYTCTGYAQTNIKKAWKDANPVKEGSVISVIEKIKIHEDYLTHAVAKDDITQQFYGNIYLYTDNMDEQNYPAAVPFILAAENIARQSGNINWQGFVKLRTGWVACIVQNDIKTAIKEYEMGAKLCAQAKDSLCLAECFEQISAMYSGLKEYDQSQHYFDLAIPILRRFTTVSLDAAYNNFSSLLARQERFTEALVYIDSAIQIVQKQKNKRKEIALLTNRAVVLHNLKRYDSAEVVFKYCMAADGENKWMGNLMHDYEGLSENYHDKGNDAAAYEYLNKYHTLKDSLAGVAVNLKIAGIIAANKSELDKLAAKNSLQTRNWIIITCVLILGFIILMWLSQLKRAKIKLANTKANLEQLTRTLIEKNSRLSALEEKLSEQEINSVISNPVLPEILDEKTHHTKEAHTNKEKLAIESQTDDFEKNIYNQQILTPADWSAFKIYFEKAYPGYLFRLRNAFPALSEAEERLFLFIKLKLTNKESAAILGISVDSVRKTKIRLRKRLELNEDIPLDNFICDF